MASVTAALSVICNAPISVTLFIIEKPYRQDMAGVKMVMCYSGSSCPSPVKVGLARPFNSPLRGSVGAAYHNGGLIPGIIMDGSSVCLIPWGGQAIAKSEYYMLSNPDNVGVQWVRANSGNVPDGALQGGYSETGEKLYIGRITHGRQQICGKVHPSHSVCYIPFNGQEVRNSAYEVLCLKTIPLANLGL